MAATADVMVINPAEDFSISSVWAGWLAKPPSTRKHSARPSYVGFLDSYAKMDILVMKKWG